jgi:hypothetical protein
MLNKRKVCDLFTEIIAFQIYGYEFFVPGVSDSDWDSIIRHAQDKYRNDYVFHNKVQKVVSELLCAIDASEETD